MPRFVGAVPPDSYSATGQLWRNPVYDWDTLGKTGFRWSIDRVRALLSHVDLIRLDHFRGFAAAWHVPAGASTAESGEWVRGPGAAFFNALKKELGGLPIIAEDLGLITPDVIALRDEFELAGTRILQFAFDGHSDNPHLPRNVVPNTVLYTGNHDDPTTREWYEALTDSERLNVWSELKRSPVRASSAATPELLRQTWMSQAALAIAPLQDVFNLGEGNRMNRPGRAGGNWSWKYSDRMLAGPAFQWLKDLTGVSKRRGG